jgi:hypothetical protein
MIMEVFVGKGVMWSYLHPTIGESEECIFCPHTMGSHDASDLWALARSTIISVKKISSMPQKSIGGIGLFPIIRRVHKSNEIRQ